MYWGVLILLLATTDTCICPSLRRIYENRVLSLNVAETWELIVEAYFPLVKKFESGVAKRWYHACINDMSSEANWYFGKDFLEVTSQQYHLSSKQKCVMHELFKFTIQVFATMTMVYWYSVSYDERHILKLLDLVGIDRGAKCTFSFTWNRKLDCAVLPLLRSFAANAEIDIATEPLYRDFWLLFCSWLRYFSWFLLGTPRKAAYLTKVSYVVMLTKSFMYI